MVSLSNHEGLARAAVRDRFMVRQAHHEAVNSEGRWYELSDHETTRAVARAAFPSPNGLVTKTSSGEAAERPSASA
jgi:hypothetical protein